MTQPDRVPNAMPPASLNAGPGFASPILADGTVPDDDRMKNAIAFLQHPKVITASLQQKVSFLQSKGLSKDEICRAFRKIDLNSPDADSIEKGAVDVCAAANTPFQVPSRPVATTQSPMAAYPPQQPMPITYYPYVPHTHPPPPPSRLPLIPALAAVMLAAGGGLAYFYRHIIAEKIVSCQKKEPELQDKTLRNLCLEMAEKHEALVDSLQKQSENTQTLLKQVLAKLESMPANAPSTHPEPLSRSPVNEYVSRPGTLSPAVQALLETTTPVPPMPAPLFEFATAHANLEQALSELGSSPDSAPAISVLKIYIKNLVETGSESTRYHRISVASPTFEQKVAPCVSAIDILKAVGFRQTDGYLVWQAPLGDVNLPENVARKQILAVALDRLTEMAAKLEPREGDAA